MACVQVSASRGVNRCPWSFPMSLRLLMHIACSLPLADPACTHGLNRHISFMMPSGFSAHFAGGTPSVGIQYPLAPILRLAMASRMCSIAAKPAHFRQQQVVTMVAVPPLHQSLISEFIHTLAKVQATPVYCIPGNNVTKASENIRRQTSSDDRRPSGTGNLPQSQEEHLK